MSANRQPSSTVDSFIIMVLQLHLETIAKLPGTSFDAWEGSLKVEALGFSSDLREAVEAYIETIIGAARMGLLNPGLYASAILYENQGLPPTWRFYCESTARVHGRMRVNPDIQGDAVRLTLVQRLSDQFDQIIRRAGISHEGQERCGWGYLLQTLFKISRR